MTPTGLPGLAAVAADVVAGPVAADVVAGPVVADVVAGPVAVWSAMSAVPHPLTAKAKATMAATVQLISCS